MNYILKIICLVSYLLIPSIFAIDVKTITYPLKSCSISDLIVLQFKISSFETADLFVLKDLEKLELNNLDVKESSISIITNNEKILTSYIFHFIFKPKKIGNCEIKPLSIRFSRDRTVNIDGYVFSVVSFWQHNRLFIGLSIFMVLFVFYLIVLKQRKIKVAKLILHKKLRAELLEKHTEQKNIAFQQFKKLGKYTISGEYKLFCSQLIQIFGNYFFYFIKIEHPEFSNENLRFELRNILNQSQHRKVEDFLNLAEEIQFTNKPPQSNDTYRLVNMAKEIIAEHRANI